MIFEGKHDDDNEHEDEENDDNDDDVVVLMILESWSNSWEVVGDGSLAKDSDKIEGVEDDEVKDEGESAAAVVAVVVFVSRVVNGKLFFPDLNLKSTVDFAFAIKLLSISIPVICDGANVIAIQIVMRPALQPISNTRLLANHTGSKKAVRGSWLVDW